MSTNAEHVHKGSSRLRFLRPLANAFGDDRTHDMSPYANAEALRDDSCVTTIEDNTNAAGSREGHGAPREGCAWRRYGTSAAL